MITGTLSPASTRATWSESVELTDEDGGDPIDLSDVDEITVEIRDPASMSSVLTATLGDGVTIIETGVFQFEFSKDDMNDLCPKTYEIGCTIEKDDQTVQLLIGYVPVVDGIVS